LGLLAFTLGIGVLWLNPTIMASRLSDDTVTYKNFLFGSYPDEERLEEIAREGYTIVSLVHPAVLPFEARVLSLERAQAVQRGIDFIHIPMLPWMSQNKEAIQDLEELVTCSPD
jgi:hypothetical protein